MSSFLTCYCHRHRRRRRMLLLLLLCFVVIRRSSKSIVFHRWFFGSSFAAKFSVFFVLLVLVARSTNPFALISNFDFHSVWTRLILIIINDNACGCVRCHFVAIIKTENMTETLNACNALITFLISSKIHFISFLFVFTWCVYVCLRVFY